MYLGVNGAKSEVDETPLREQAPVEEPRAPIGPLWKIGAIWLIPLGYLVLILFRDQVRSLVEVPATQAWFTIFVAICLQALPFLVFGVVLSGLLTAFVPPGAIARRLPKRPAFAVPAAGVAGMALPGCECASVPLAGRLVDNRVPASAALTFLLAAPAINPVVLVATSVAFPGQPQMVVARFVASLVAAVVVGWIWVRVGKDAWMGRSRREIGPTSGRWQVFTGTATHDLLHAGGYLILGGMTAATLQVVVPRSILDALGGSGVLAVATMAILAVVLSVCSEADAFVVAGLTQFSLTSRLVFLVVGPMVDLKLIAMQSGVFGRQFTVRFAPLAFAAAVVSAVVVGSILL
jgi:uncharacterized protein